MASLCSGVHSLPSTPPWCPQSGATGRPDASAQQSAEQPSETNFIKRSCGNRPRVPQLAVCVLLQLLPCVRSATPSAVGGASLRNVSRFSCWCDNPQFQLSPFHFHRALAAARNTLFWTATTTTSAMCEDCDVCRELLFHIATCPHLPERSRPLVTSCIRVAPFFFSRIQCLWQRPNFPRRPTPIRESTHRRSDGERCVCLL